MRLRCRCRQDSSDAGGDAGSRQTVEARLAKVGLHLHSWWIYDVAEWLHTPRDLYHLLTFGNAPEEVPSWRESEPQLTRIFERHAVAAGLELRNRRFLWKAILHAEPSPLRTCSPTS